MTSPATPRPRIAHAKPKSTPTTRRILAITSLGLAGLLAGLLAGCSTAVAPSSPNSSFSQTSGNWQFSSTASAASRLSSVGGSIAVDGTSVTGLLHPLSASSHCVQTSAALLATGSITASGVLTLSAPVAGGTLAISGTLAPDRRSLSAATYTLTGGACAASPVPQTASQPATQTVAPRDTTTPPVTAQQFQPLSGTYTGTLTTDDGEKFGLITTITQTSQPDADGIYHATGTASSPGNSCIPETLNATGSTIAGGSVSTTYTDPSSGTSITGSGTSSPDASSITIGSWTINSACGSDSGTGLLLRQTGP